MMSDLTFVLSDQNGDTPLGQLYFRYFLIAYVFKAKLCWQRI